MDAENFVVNDSGKGQVVEDFSAIAPDVDWTILAKALVVEAIYLRDLAWLVIASYESNTFGVTNLQSE